MQKVEISGGYVEISEKVTRKIAKEYVSVLTANSVNDKIIRTDMEEASEYLALALITRVVLIAADGTEHEQTPDQDWLGNLDEADFQKVGAKVYGIYKAAKERSKK